MTLPAPKHIEITGDTKPVWTQGMDSDGHGNGSFEVREFALTLPQAAILIAAMPTCKIVPDKQRYCPPAFGFDGVNICRIETGEFYTWPDQLRLTSLHDALAWLASNWRG